MDYRIAHGESVEDGVRRIARERLADALEPLRDPHGGPDAAVHEARKRFKEIRGLLRLVRKDIGEKAFDRENRAYRDAGRALAPLRESAVAPETLDRVREAYASVLRPGAFDRSRCALAARHRVVQARAREEGAVDDALSLASAAGERIADWALSGRGFQALGPGLRKVYKRGRNRLADALEEPSDARFHEWRKRVKYLWYHLRLLERVWPPVMTALADEAHELSDLLGDAHDASDLTRALEEVEVPEEERAALSALARRWEEERWRSAECLGARLYASSPDAFVERVEAWFEAEGSAKRA